MRWPWRKREPVPLDPMLGRVEVSEWSQGTGWTCRWSHPAVNDARWQACWHDHQDRDNAATCGWVLLRKALERERRDRAPWTAMPPPGRKEDT